MTEETGFVVGDMVISIGRNSTLRSDDIYVIMNIGKESNEEIVKLKGGKLSSSGWWVYSKDVIRVNRDKEDCRFCTSTCRKEEPCPFFIGVWEVSGE